MRYYRARILRAQTLRTLITKLVLDGGFLFDVDSNWKLPLGHELKGAAALQEYGKGDESDAGKARHGRMMEKKKKWRPNISPRADARCAGVFQQVIRST